MQFIVDGVEEMWPFLKEITVTVSGMCYACWTTVVSDGK